ncbi:hypothetical protein BHE74_00017771 [Ensete ventricosum]|nr:hypothetical protein BHE74_00017771 [Ensete ventricosum]RZS02416.1 hypothetical protein BHM03_00032473 [Ensete ventricosum]
MPSFASSRSGSSHQRSVEVSAPSQRVVQVGSSSIGGALRVPCDLELMHDTHDYDSVMATSQLERLSPLSCSGGVYLVCPGRWEASFSLDPWGFFICLLMLLRRVVPSFTSLIVSCLEQRQISPSQMAPNLWRYLVAFIGECRVGMDLRGLMKCRPSMGSTKFGMTLSSSGQLTMSSRGPSRGSPTSAFVDLPTNLIRHYCDPGEGIGRRPLSHPGCLIGSVYCSQIIPGLASKPSVELALGWSNVPSVGPSVALVSLLKPFVDLASRPCLDSALEPLVELGLKQFNVSFSEPFVGPSIDPFVASTVKPSTRLYMDSS